MSHFTVAVFSRNPDDVDKLLAPYTENVDGSEDFAEYNKEDDYYFNPNAKWDWYSIGGRWSGELLRFKDGIDPNENDDPDIARCRDLDFGMNIEAYNEAIESWDKLIDPNGGGWYKPEYYLKRYRTKENYARQTASWGTFAFVDADGNWHEPGTMGWFAFDDSTYDSRIAYQHELEEYITKAIEEDLYVTIVDCHI